MNWAIERLRIAPGTGLGLGRRRYQHRPDQRFQRKARPREPKGTGCNRFGSGGGDRAGPVSEIILDLCGGGKELSKNEGTSD